MSSPAKILQPESSLQPIDDVYALTQNYDAFIVDLWGVIHDGTHLYDGADRLLRGIRDAGKTVILLSNAPRQAHKVQTVLDRLGLERDFYQQIVTSGQAAHDYLLNTDKHGTRYYYLGPEKDLDVLADLDYEQAPIEEADFVLNAGFEYDYQPEEEALPLLKKLKAHNVPFICINPDIEVVKQDGRRLLCAGHAARTYRDMGGEVMYFGKPFPAIYQVCFDAINADKSRILAVGDNLHTDIAGANTVGIESLLITGGILLQQLGEKPQADDLQPLCQEMSAWPTYFAPRFTLAK